MNIKELAKSARQSLIPPFPTDKLMRAVVIHLSCYPNKPFNPLDSDTYWRALDEARNELDREAREESERIARVREEKITEIRNKLREIAKRNYQWKTPWNEFIPYDGNLKWDVISIAVRGEKQVAERLQKVQCQRKGQELSLSHALDNILEEYARELINSDKEISELELYEKLRKQSITTHCGVESQTECTAYRTGGMVQCDTFELRLVKK